MPPSQDLDADNANGLVPASESVEPPPATPPVAYTDVNVVPEHEKEGLQHAISTLQEEIMELRSKQRYLDGQRREALNKILDVKGSIRVFCRVRSQLPSDNKRTKSPISAEPEKVTVRSAGSKKQFNVDRVFTHESTQEDVFMEVKPILRSAVDGHNVCVFAYGQTGTGKTYTMEGGTNDRRGIVPRTIEELFHHASQLQEKAASFSLSMSMLEVYMGSLRDLLAQKRTSVKSIGSTTKSGLSILTTSNGSVEIEGLTNVAITDFKQAYQWYARGKRARSTSWTNVNEASSRSHCLTRITIVQSTEEGNGVASKLWMVDLGGSERLLKTGATGQTLDEGKAINLSLSALGDVIGALKRKQNHIPYRNSKLTQILSDSLGHSSKVLMIVHMSPSEDDVGETTCSLSFAKRVRAVEPSRELSEELKKQKEKWIAELNQQINDAEGELKLVRSQIGKAECLLHEKKKIFWKVFHVEDQRGSPRSPLIFQTDIGENPQTTEKVISKSHSSSLPHFMTSTICSRRKQSSTEEVISRVGMLRLANRNPMDSLGSQSFGYSEPYLRASSKSLKSKLATCGNNITKHRDFSHLCKPDNSIDSKSSSLSRDRKVSTSQPNLRVTLYQHRRRISDLT